MDKRIRLTRAESHAQTRERLLVAARQVFARHGFGAASVDMIRDSVRRLRHQYYYRSPNIFHFDLWMNSRLVGIWNFRNQFIPIPSVDYCRWFQ
jgi:hypothetical protein